MNTPDATVRPERCRRRGRGAFLAALGLALVAVLAFGAFRAVGQGPRARGFGFGPHACSLEDAGKHVTRAVGWLIDDLDGTPEQEAKLVAIAQTALVDLAPLHAEAKANRRQIVAVLTAEKIDRARLEALRVEQVALMTTASTRITKAVADAGDVLTPAQRVELADTLAKRFHRFH